MKFRCPTVLEECDDVTYYGDKFFEGPTLSYSIAKILLNKSPYHAWLHHPRLGGVSRESSEEMDRGTIIHNLVLGGGPDLFVVQAPDWRTKDARAHRDAAVARGEIPVLEHKLEEYRLVADHIVDACREKGIDFREGESEAVILWEEETSFGPIKCRGRLDNVLFDRGVIRDLKNCDNAHPDAIARAIENMGYDIQVAAYLSAIRTVQPAIAGRDSFVWIFAEELPEGSPRRAMVNLAYPSGVLLERGAMRWRRACELWAKCLRLDHWPAYEETMVDPPAWAMKEEIGAA